MYEKITFLQLKVVPPIESSCLFLKKNLKSHFLSAEVNAFNPEKQELV